MSNPSRFGPRIVRRAFRTLDMAIDAALRPLRADDSERLLTWRNLPEVAQWMYTDHQISREEHERWFAKALSAADRRYWMVECAGKPVGLTNLTGLSLGREPEIGYYLADPAVRGRGVGLFAQYQAVEAAFGEYGVKALYSEVLADNEASRNLLERLGFRLIDTLQGRAMKAGRPTEALRFRLDFDVWRQRRLMVRDSLAARGFRI